MDREAAILLVLATVLWVASQSLYIGDGSTLDALSISFAITSVFDWFWGMLRLARSRGLSDWWALLGILSVPGLVVLCTLGRTEAKPGSLPASCA